MTAVHARVVILAGPSGAGKSRLAERLELPVVHLDDFYKNGSDPTLPRIESGPNAGLVDWDHCDSWQAADAIAALSELCESGSAELPVYDIARDGRCGTTRLTLDGQPLLIAEGIFAHEIVPELRRRGLLAGAFCVTQHRVVTFWRRLLRDLREHRKPPLVLVRRGFALMRQQGRIVTRAEALGCTRVTPEQGYRAVGRLRERAPGPVTRGER